MQNTGLLTLENIDRLWSKHDELTDLITQRDDRSHNYGVCITSLLMAISMIYVIKFHNIFELNDQISYFNIKQYYIDAVVYTSAAIAVCPISYIIFNSLTDLQLFPTRHLKNELKQHENEMKGFYNARAGFFGCKQVDLSSTDVAAKQLKQLAAKHNSHTLHCKSRKGKKKTKNFYSHAMKMSVGGAHLTDVSMTDFYANIKKRK